MKFAVITPSRNQINFIKRCIWSVADQSSDDLEVIHIVRDCQSSDGSVEFCQKFKHVYITSKKDMGMYDAINQGLKQAEELQADVFSYLNCDEQYLDGALQNVKTFFERNPNCEMVIGDVIYHDYTESGSGFLGFRKSSLPSYWKTLLHVPEPPCAWFIKMDTIKKTGLRFNTNYKIISDKIFLNKLITTKAKIGLLKEFTTVFGITGNNLGKSPLFDEEKKQYENSLTFFSRLLLNFLPLLKFIWKVKRLINFIYYSKTFYYSIYQNNKKGRKKNFCKKPYTYQTNKN